MFRKSLATTIGKLQPTSVLHVRAASARCVLNRNGAIHDCERTFIEAKSALCNFIRLDRLASYDRIRFVLARVKGSIVYVGEGICAYIGASRLA